MCFNQRHPILSLPVYPPPPIPHFPSQLHVFSCFCLFFVSFTHSLLSDVRANTKVGPSTRAWVFPMDGTPKVIIFCWPFIYNSFPARNVLSQDWDFLFGFGGVCCYKCKCILILLIDFGSCSEDLNISSTISEYYNTVFCLFLNLN